MKYFEGSAAIVPKVFEGALPSFIVQNGGLQNKNLLVGPFALRQEVLQALHDDATARHLAVSQVRSLRVRSLQRTVFMVDLT